MTRKFLLFLAVIVLLVLLMEGFEQLPRWLDKPRHDLRCMGVQFSRPCLAYISSTSHQAVQGQDDACED